MPLTLENSIWGQLYKEEWKEEGLREGIEQGATKEKYIVALNMMRNDYTDKQVVDITNLILQQVLIVRQKYNELGEAAYQWVDEEFLKKRKQL